MAPNGVRRRNNQTKSQDLARQWLTKGGIFREDSDDELGYDDHPWEWIYETDNTDTGRYRCRNLPDDDVDSQTPTKRRKKVTPLATQHCHQKKIIGARMGSFECRLGQSILLKSPEPGKDWAGIICEFLEEEDEDGEDQGMIKCANIMWFASPDEFISTKNKRRADALPNEQYLTVDFNINPLTAINGKAIILSKDVFYARYPNGTPPIKRAELAEYNKCIVCRRGVNQLQGKYTEEFIWEDIYHESERGVFELIEKIKFALRGSRKRKEVDTPVSEEDFP
jgi:origin recognition complex subunit 1